MFNHPNTVYKFDHQSTLFPCNTQLCPSYVSRIPLGVSFSNPCNFAQGAWQPHPQYKARYDEHGLHVAGKDPQPPWYLVQTNQICTFETLPVTHPGYLSVVCKKSKGKYVPGECWWRQAKLQLSSCKKSWQNRQGRNNIVSGLALIGQFRTHPSKAGQTRRILPAASLEGSCAGTAAVSKTQLSVGPAAFVLFNRFHRTGCFTGMPVKFTLGKSRTAWTKWWFDNFEQVCWGAWSTVCFLNLTQQFKWAPFFPFFEATIVYFVFGKKVGVSRRLLSVFLW